MKRNTLAFAALAFAMQWTRLAAAGLLDSPPPSLDGGASRVVYRMGPVYFEAGRADTIVSCTNIGDGPVSLAIEIFDGEGRLAASAKQTRIAPGAGVSFGTSAVDGRPGLVVADPLTSVTSGKARVSATATTISCSAGQIVRGEDGTARELPLQLVKKVAF